MNNFFVFVFEEGSLSQIGNRTGYKTYEEAVKIAEMYVDDVWLVVYVMQLMAVTSNDSGTHVSRIGKGEILTG